MSSVVNLVPIADRSSLFFLITTPVLFLLSYLLRTAWSYRQSKAVTRRSRRISEESAKRPDLKIDEKEVSAVKVVASEEIEKQRYVGIFDALENAEVTYQEKERVKEDKVLYHQLQNIEDHPEGTNAARIRLTELFDRTMHAASQQSPSSTILAVNTYTPQALEQHFAGEHTSSTNRYEAYLARRKKGGPRELFPTREHAVRWLRTAAVVKYVDGGWVANVLGVDTAAPKGSKIEEGDYPGGPERRAGKLAWQVISEEFGDGDLDKNHVYVYNELLKGLHPSGLSATGAEQHFDGLADDEGSPRCWTAAVAQQCIGLLSSTDDYFPEALGFNMAYETLPYHLLVTSRELRELKLDDYYFALHITIDNPDSGHAAIARASVDRYLEGVRVRDGQKAMERMWRRVQAGVILADGLPTTPWAPVDFAVDPVTRLWKPVPQKAAVAGATEIESRLVKLLGRKAIAAEKMHCPSRILIKGHTIEYWLAPATFTFDKGLEFVRALAEKRPWVSPGSSPKSKLVQELEWGGRMFGAFSRDEVNVVKRWIEALGQVESAEGAYERYIGVGEKSIALPIPLRDVSTDVIARFASTTQTPHSFSSLATLPTRSSSSMDINQFAAVWFTSIALVERFPLSPAKFATPLGSSVLRILRAQLGFPALHTNDDICAGMDDVFAEEDGPANVLGLWEIGYDMCRRRGLDAPAKQAELLEWIESNSESSTARFCSDMLELRLRPYTHQATLLGITYGTTLHLIGSEGVRTLATSEEQVILARIKGEIVDAINGCVEEQSASSSEGWWGDFVNGFERARSEIGTFA
ncbi:hypothetical protein CI109_100034 [Kwoniella shandongensis]|uniref:Uncharacterized protein n=1 Tax=Kwoniella shandongensis TaxID=1734106 RepID=A0A5M6BVU1_9TREE|nr:uncharacterized protein CI109_005993 [Kwoniella shandongensis]KAA5525685.1 hypothetical protein CI109_005993 [Kwoniella shandongensis]